MTAQHVAWLLLGLGSGLASGYPWGRWTGRRKLDREWDDGYRQCLDDIREFGPRPGNEGVMPDGWSLAASTRQLEFVPRPESTGVTGRAVPERGPGRPDWREQVAADLAPEALALDVPRPEQNRAERTTGDSAAVMSSSPPASWPGHPSPYAGPLTPAQRRRDKHKHRGQWAAVTYPEVGPPLLGPPSEWMAAHVERWKHEMASIGESDWLARELTAVA